MPQGGFLRNPPDRAIGIVERRDAAVGRFVLRFVKPS
jgi:hypothetical protein